MPGSFEIRARGVGRRRAPRFRVLRTDVDPVKEVARFKGRKGSRRGVWDGQVDGAPAPPGTYMVVVRVRDRSGNLGTAPAVLPPVPGQVRGKPGITVRQIAAQPPVGAGARRRAGRSSSSTRAAAPTAGTSAASAPRGRSRRAPRRRGRRSSMRAPRGVSGAYLLQVRSGRYSARVPFLVQAQERAKLLVVAPTLSWLGVDKVDDDGDGLPNTLETRRPGEVAARDQRRRGMPPAFATETAPLLVFLDRARIRYDLTSDIALARSRDPRATDREGVLLAGSLRWVPRPLARRLRALRRVRRAARELRHRVAAPRRAGRPEPPHAADPADPDRPVRRAARAGRQRRAPRTTAARRCR